MEGITDDVLARAGRDGVDAALADTPHYLIPAELAPGQFQAGIGRFLEGHPFDCNVMGISRFPQSAGDPVAAGLEACRNACTAAGFELHLASDRNVEDLLFGNVAACMWACRYGIALLEDKIGNGLNYNAILEVGAMLATGRRCLLLKDSTCPTLPTDLVGHIYASVELDSPDSVTEAVGAWLRDIA
jgi:hypothetical protein